MKNKTSDIFEISQTKKSSVEESSNFFLTPDAAAVKPIKTPSLDKMRRLNDYDFNLLKEDAYKDVTDDVFKLEYKIARTEEEIKALGAQIQAANDINDSNMLDELNKRKKVLEEDYETLIALYNDKSISARITESIANIMGTKFKTTLETLKEKYSSLAETILLKIPGPFSSVVELRKSLNKLENINRSVDELMAMNYPYGENLGKYDQLSKFIIKANEIQTEINQYMGAQIKEKNNKWSDFLKENRSIYV